MYQEILKKRQLLESRKPYNYQIRNQIRTEELLDIIYTSLHLDGSAIKKETIGKILEGEFVAEGTTVSDHLAIQHYIETISLIDNLLGMDSDLSLKAIVDIHDMACGTEGPIWRRKNPVLYTFDYNPPHWQEVSSELEGFVRWYYRSEEELSSNVLLRAVMAHNKIIEIYPFEHNSEVTARLIMYFIIIRGGFPVFELRLSEGEYNSGIVEYLKNKKTEILYKAVERGVFNKLDVMLQLTAEDET